MNLEIEFSNSAQRAFYFSNARNQCFSGGFNNGKSYGGCLKAFTLLSTFNNYRMAIARQVYADLKRTTMQTFFKICPHELIERHNEQDGLTVLRNGSHIYWMHLDSVDEGALKGLEVNSILVDQAEEIEEKTYDILDARLGRWEKAVVPQDLLDKFPNWPRKRGNFLAPSYHMLLCNPDTQYHFIFRKFHPESPQRRDNYFFVEGEWDSSLGSEEGYAEALKHDSEWVEKFVKGKWGLSSAQIHRLLPESQIDYDATFVERLLKKGNLFRSMDHGDSSPTCCLWFAAIGGVHICYREYYSPNQPISVHRQAIHDLSGCEHYSMSFADPQIFKKTAQKDGGFWTVSDEYSTNQVSGPPLYWTPADNNEFATRNRINELLRPCAGVTHPLSGVAGAPKLYFIKKSPEYPHGCHHSIIQLQSQRRKLLGYLEGKAIYCDDREDTVTDHAYDPTRYYVAMHGREPSESSRPVPRRSFKYYMNLKKLNKLVGQFEPASIGG